MEKSQTRGNNYRYNCKNHIATRYDSNMNCTKQTQGKAVICLNISNNYSDSKCQSFFLNICSCDSLHYQQMYYYMFFIFYLDVLHSLSKSHEFEITDTLNLSHSSINESINGSIDPVQHTENYNVQKKLETNKLVSEYEKSDQNSCTVTRQLQSKIVFFLFLYTIFKETFCKVSIYYNC